MAVKLTMAGYDGKVSTNCKLTFSKPTDAIKYVEEQVQEHNVKHAEYQMVLKQHVMAGECETLVYSTWTAYSYIAVLEVI